MSGRQHTINFRFVSFLDALSLSGHKTHAGTAGFRYDFANRAMPLALTRIVDDRTADAPNLVRARARRREGSAPCINRKNLRERWSNAASRFTRNSGPDCSRAFTKPSLRQCCSRRASRSTGKADHHKIQGFGASRCVPGRPDRRGFSGRRNQVSRATRARARETAPYLSPLDEAALGAACKFRGAGLPRRCKANRQRPHELRVFASSRASRIDL